MGTIYLILNNATGGFYVGKTDKNLPAYFREQINAARRGWTNKPHLYNAIRKYGAENFTISVLTEAPSGQLNELEKLWILVLRAREIGYNLAPGGEGGTTLGFKGKRHSEESRRRISASKRGQQYSAEFREKCRQRMTGNTFAAGVTAHRGLKRSPEARQKMSAAAKLRRLNQTPEQREEMLKQLAIGRKTRWGG